MLVILTETLSILRFCALKTHGRTNIRPLIKIGTPQFRTLVQLVLRQNQFLQIIEHIRPLIFDLKSHRLRILRKAAAFGLQFFDECCPELFLVRWGAGEVEAVRVVVAFGLADGAVDL